MTGFFQQPELTPKPVLEPSSFDVLRDLYASKLVNQQANPYGFDPSKGQSMESLYTGNGRGTFNPYNGSYGPNPPGYANQGSMAGPSMGGSGGGQGGMYGFGGGGQMGGGPQAGGDSSRSALIAYIMELMKGQPGGGMGQQQAPLMPGSRPMGQDGYTLNNQITGQGSAFDGCQIGHDAAPAQPPQVDPANYGNSFDTATKWLAMNPGNHGAFGTTPSHQDPNNPFGMAGGGGSARSQGSQGVQSPMMAGQVGGTFGGPGSMPPSGPPRSNPGGWGPAPATPSVPTPNPGGWGRTPVGPPSTPPQTTMRAPLMPSQGSQNMVPHGNPKFPIGMDSPYMFQRGPMSPLGMDAFPGAPGAGGGGFVGFSGGGQAPLSPGTMGGGGIQALIQALMSGGGGGGMMGGGGGGMMRRRKPMMGMQNGLR